LKQKLLRGLYHQDVLLLCNNSGSQDGFVKKCKRKDAP
jgi:hypothetical protein